MKKFFVSIILCSLCFASFALVGVKQIITDASGEYVYYKDFSFLRESYVGFLYYDEGAYGLRYFAPATPESPQKNVELLLSVDSTKDYVDITGERFITPPQEDDTEIINYLHDMFYELAGRRKKLGELPLTDYSKSRLNFVDEGKSVSDTFGQFGGRVTMIYDAIVPIFNLKKILDYKGSTILCAVTAGRISSSEDKTFSNFVPPTVNSTTSTEKINTDKKTTLSFIATSNAEKEFTQSIQADTKWKEASEGMWLYGNSAIINLTGFIFREKDTLKADSELLRMFLASSSANFTDWTNYTVRYEKERFRISGTKYNVNGKNIVRDIRTFHRFDKDTFALFILTVFEDDYKANRPYFDTIIKSYKVK